MKPTNHKESKGNMVNLYGKAKISLFSKEQMELLQKLFGQPQSIPSSSVIATGTMAHKGIHALHVKRSHSNVWIVDSEASDHMTRDSRLFTTISPCREKWTVWIVDGTQSQVAGIGTMKLIENFTLHSVLFVPSLD